MDKIISLEVNNIKRIKAVSILADATMNTISGKNGNGKSSTLDAIEMALRGAKYIPDMPVRAGQEDARIVVETNEMTVTRHWTNADTSYLKIVTKQLGKIANPQDTLNAIVGNLSFDPLEFATMEPKKRIGILKEITKLDFSKLEAEYKTTFAERAGVKKEYETLKTLTDQFSQEELIKPDFDIEDIKFKRSEAEKHNQEIDKLSDYLIPENEKAIKASESSATSIELEIKELKNQIKTIEQTIFAKNQSVEMYRRNAYEATVELAKKFELKENSKKINTDQFDEMMKRQNQYEAELKTRKSNLEVIRTRDDKFTLANKMTARLEEIIKEKEKQITNANMPIKGLSFADNDILFNEIPFIQLSTSEQIQVSMSIAMALNPRLRIIIIKNGSLLDSDAMKKIYDLAHENNFQIWLEKVADTPDGNSIFIEDGEVYGAEKTEETEDAVQVHTGDEAGVL